MSTTRWSVGTDGEEDGGGLGKEFDKGEGREEGGREGCSRWEEVQQATLVWEEHAPLVWEE